MTPAKVPVRLHAGVHVLCAREDVQILVKVARIPVQEPAQDLVVVAEDVHRAQDALAVLLLAPMIAPTAARVNAQVVRMIVLMDVDRLVLVAEEIVRNFVRDAAAHVTVLAMILVLPNALLLVIITVVLHVMVSCLR